MVAEARDLHADFFGSLKDRRARWHGNGHAIDSDLDQVWCGLAEGPDTCTHTHTHTARTREQMAQSKVTSGVLAGLRQ